MYSKLLLTLIFSSLALCCWSQDSISTVERISGLPQRFLDKANKKTAYIDKELTRKTDRYLRRLIKQEAKLKKRLQVIDSTAAKTLFAAGATQRYEALLQKVKKASAQRVMPLSGKYSPYLDSLQGVLSFLNESKAVINGVPLLPGKAAEGLEQLKQLQARMQQADVVKQFIQQRKEQIRRYLQKYTNLPGSVSKLFKAYSKQAYYYGQQLKEYKDILNDPDKMLKTALRLLNKVPAFSQFMNKHSMLAGIFNLPGRSVNSNAANITGLQTRDQLMTLIQNRMGGAPNATAILTQSMQAAQQQLDDLRNKLSLRGIGGGELDMPDFKPNNQKTKSFWRRLEYGSNLQTTSGRYYFPITTDLGLSVGYKLNDKNVIGIGASYKIGWGKDIRNIRISSQGAGLRSFVDINVKKSFYISGGFEMNYQPLSVTDSLPAPSAFGRDWSEWQQSGLIGLTKIISLKTKFLKKTKVQLLWDFLSYQQAPGTPALKFRVGYSF